MARDASEGGYSHFRPLNGSRSDDESGEESAAILSDHFSTDPPIIDGNERSKKAFGKEETLLFGDKCLSSNTHGLTYIGIFLFTAILYFRPYELVPAFKGFDSMALIAAVASLLVYLPAQILSEGRPTILTTEVKCVLFLLISALLTIPLAKDPSMAWMAFSTVFVKVGLIFVVLVNVLRTKTRLTGLMLLSMGVGIMLSLQALDLYRKGTFSTEGYRVNVDFGGMFGNPNDMALHLVIFAPVALAMGIAATQKIWKLLCFLSAGVMVLGIMVTQSRGGFLGLVVVAGMLVWKLGRGRRIKSILTASVLGICFIAFAPGNYGNRIASIFIPSLDPVGSSTERTEALKWSIEVTLRNPLGIGIGNTPIVGVRDHETHNAYTQISSELGWLPFVAYLILLATTWKRLAGLQRRTVDQEENYWIYYYSIGIQAGLAGYMVSSFFASVAYQWYVYYLIAYAFGLTGIYRMKSAAGSAVTENGEAIRIFPQMT